MSEKIKSSEPIVRTDAMREWAEEQLTADANDGESQRERRVGVDREIVVDIFKRNFNMGDRKKGTMFLRVSLRSMIRNDIIMRYETDLDRYSSESDFLQNVMLGAGALAEQDNEQRGANWDCEYIANQGRQAARELIHDIDSQS